VIHWTETNRLWWDERVDSHAESTMYDLAGFVSGEHPDRLRPFEADELGVDPTGIDLLHLQCHLGTDTLSWARRGAHVTGVDFSEPAIEQARALASACGIEAAFVHADVLDAPAALGGRTFDVVYTGMGALSWLSDIDRWAHTAAALVEPGGVLYVVEIHPILWVFDDDEEEPVVAWPYFGPISTDTATGSYTDRNLPTAHNTTCERNWGFGPVLTAVARAGLQIELVAEHEIGIERCWPFMQQEPNRPDLWRLPEERSSLPLSWSMRARKP
jgi:2-polyprenyl-3-methyl-5-hydroxy-6-metoxy-1,4-benzoquinol methylase